MRAVNLSSFVHRVSGDLRRLLVVALVLALVGCVAPAPPVRGSGRTAGVEDARVARAASRDTAASDDAASPDWADDAATETDADAAADDPSMLVAEALEACESARVMWERGEIEEALSSLDHAYGLLIDIPADVPELAQDREDLRHLISQRVVEIYRSQRSSAGDLASAIPRDMNEHVEREIRSFQGRERDFFLDSYRRSGEYRPMMLRQLRAAGMPEELSWLPLVESGFKTRALSSARAMGLWQFISSTGYRFGLSRSEWVDERMDPVKATGAAVAYLTDLHGMFGDWMTALASYNCGEHRVMRLIREQPDAYLDQFWDLFGKLPRETRRYVPRFLATLHIVEDPAKYGFELPEPLPAIETEVVSVSRQVRLTDLSESLGLAKHTLGTLNPALRHGVTPDDAYSLQVPGHVVAQVEPKITALATYEAPRVAFITHTVRRGETLSSIARRHGSSVTAIMRDNNLRSRNRIRIGQRLKIESRRGARPAASLQPAKTIVHRIRSGDSLWKLASRYGTTVDQIKRDNGIRGSRLYVGRTLKIASAGSPAPRTYAVRRGDTLGKIARAHRVSLNAVLRANGLNLKSTIYPGKIIVIPQ